MTSEGGATGKLMHIFKEIHLLQRYGRFVVFFFVAGVCGTTADAISVTSPFSSIANGFPPTVCGTLTGQHSM